MRIVFFGTPQFAVPTLQALIHHPQFEVGAVVTQPDRRRGRGSQLVPSPVKSVALERSIPVWEPVRIKKDPIVIDQLRATQADAFVVVAYGQILSQEILDIPRLGCVNVHGSLLPKYRGAAPIQWCLYHGELETGNTTMLMDAGMDTGAMLLRQSTPIALLENAQDVAERLATQGADLLVETLLKLDQGQITPIPQAHGVATYAPLIQKQDYELDWSRPAIALHNQIRGFYPNCVTQFRDSPLKIGATIPLLPHLRSVLPEEFAAMIDNLAIPDPGEPGTIVQVIKGVGAVVQTGDGFLLLHRVQPQGKRQQSGWDFCNGSHVAIGEVLGEQKP